MVKEQILNNNFIDKILVNMEVDEKEYSELCDALIRLAKEWKNEKYVDKEIVNYLYAIPLAVRNEFLSLKESGYDDTLCDRLEDMWVELDDLVAKCFC